MNNDERLNLAKMINVNNVKDQTANIQKLKHSKLLLQDVNRMCDIKKKYSRMGKESISDMCFSQCSFMSSQYMDIYNKLLKDELNVVILYAFISKLRDIEEGRLDQHEASFEVGKLLKRLYIDSALKKAERIDNGTKEGIKLKTGKNIKWKEFNKRGRV
jgi:hypothetical protein